MNKPTKPDVSMYRFTEGQLLHLEKVFPRIPITPGMDRETIMYQAGIQRVLDWVREKGLSHGNLR